MTLEGKSEAPLLELVVALAVQLTWLGSGSGSGSGLGLGLGRALSSGLTAHRTLGRGAFDDHVLAARGDVELLLERQLHALLDVA